MKTVRRTFQVERREINYLRVTIESYDGMAMVRTLDPRLAIIELRISSGCLELVDELLEDLRSREKVMIKKIDKPVYPPE